MHSIIPVILAGGSGSRLWPLSRSSFPKQFLSLLNKEDENLSMLQLTLKRQLNISSNPPILICNEDHRFLVSDQLLDIGSKESKVILEPAARDTAPAIALAALNIMEQYGDALMLIQTADHLIEGDEAFINAVTKASDLAEKGDLVTFGIQPTKPETGYGYIRAGETIGDLGCKVEKFVEKPDLEKANKYLKSGKYFWNSGMFMFKASTFLSEMKKYAPDVLEACETSYIGKSSDLGFIRVNKESFMKSPSISIDYSIMEKTNLASMVPLSAEWKDIGSWDALWELHDKDENLNSCHGDTALIDTKNSLVHSSHRLVTTLGLEDTVVIETKDTVLVAKRDKVQDIKKIVNHLDESNRTEHIQNREVFRPWGKYDSVDEGHRYQVKRITVNPSEKLSVQMHYHRAEHWIVVKGTAKVTIDENEILLTENESVHIPTGSVHSLENPGKLPLELIEVQSGPYLGEDDIVRFEDNYGRIKD